MVAPGIAEALLATASERLRAELSEDVEEAFKIAAALRAEEEADTGV